LPAIEFQLGAGSVAVAPEAAAEAGSIDPRSEGLLAAGELRRDSSDGRSVGGAATAHASGRSTADSTLPQQPGSATVPATGASSESAARELAAGTADPIEGSAGARDARSASEPARGGRNAAQSAAPSPHEQSSRVEADPLARLIGQSRIAPRPEAGREGDPVAARLAEVEGAIARSRVAAAVERGAVEIEASSAQPAGTAQATAVIAQDALQPTQGVPASSLDAEGAPALAGSSLLAETEPHPAAQLASKGAAILANQRGGAITMRLEPPALGQLRIELHVHQGAVVADFTAATPEARVLLEANLGMLRERLESQGLSVERISVHGGRGTESTAPVSASAGSDPRQDGADARSDRGDRGERSGTRQDAAGGESRGRRDGDARAGRDRTDAGRQGGARGFAAALSGVAAQRTEPMRRAS